MTAPDVRSRAALVPLVREIEPDVPVVTMSGLAPPDGDDLAVHRFLSKPFRSKPFRADDLIVAARAALTA